MWPDSLYEQSFCRNYYACTSIFDGIFITSRTFGGEIFDWLYLYMACIRYSISPLNRKTSLPKLHKTSVRYPKKYNERHSPSVMIKNHNFLSFLVKTLIIVSGRVGNNRSTDIKCYETGYASCWSVVHYLQKNRKKEQYNRAGCLEHRRYDNI